MRLSFIVALPLEVALILKTVRKVTEKTATTPHLPIVYGIHKESERKHVLRQSLAC